MDLTAAEIRVLGCLIEKQMTTPDYYPMTQNALENACNQSTSRDPVVAYTDAQVIDAVNGLRDRGWARAVHAPGQRAVKYRHVVDEVLGIGAGEAAVLAVLLLRGDQTAGELRTRTSRFYDFTGVAEVGDILGGLAGREEPMAERLGRRPGEKENRWRHLLGDGAEVVAAPPEPEERGGLYPSWQATGGSGDERVAALEADVATLRDEVAALRRNLDRVVEELS